MLAAKIFFRAGFDIQMRPEKLKIPGEKKRGEEFDFTAVRKRRFGKRQIINAEVTALQDKEFYEKTAINALRNKRDQVPRDHPAVMFCVIPERWGSLDINLDEWSANVANEFFLSGTRRINRLVFYMEHHIDGPISGGGGYVTVARPYDGPNPYHAYNFDHIFESGDKSELMALRIENALGDHESEKEVAKVMRKGEFFEWVDSLHDE